MKELSTTVLADGFVFLEGPRWRGDKLWLSDMHGHAVYTLGINGQHSKVVDVPAKPSGIGFLPDGTPLIVSMHDRKLMKLVNGKLELHADLSSLCPYEINDMVVDKKGNAYVGNIGFDIFKKEKFKPTNFVLVTAVGNVREVATDLHVPNGPVVTPDGKTLIVAESWANRLTAFSINDDGSLCDRHVFADLGDAAPDGICLDAEGAVWLAAFNQDHFIRVLEGGEITHRVKVVKRSPVACTLGGPDGCTLFGLTYQGSIADMGRGKAASRVEIATVDVPASGSP
ncbi:MAG: SMP-30/gluconolactonase/LRE family protein [Porticoccaceae bacterium]|nr:SMP-30/gluconolactonase/LRE family protein [Porticoccaceae bacterium]